VTRGRGGRRRGKTGKAYPNRSDMQAQAVESAPGQVYGQRTAQEQAQRAIPLPQGAATPTQAPPPPAPPPPGSLGFTEPTSMPDEPLTAGLPIGAGPGPEILNRPIAPASPDARAAFKIDVLSHLQTLPFASPEIEQLLARTRSESAQF
jgi:hypothetical protein